MRKTASIILFFIVSFGFAQSFDSAIVYNSRYFSYHDVFADSTSCNHSSMDIMNRSIPQTKNFSRAAKDFYPQALAEVFVGNEFSFLSSAGIMFQQTTKNKIFSFVTNPRLYFSNYPDFIGEKFDRMNVFPGGGKTLYSSGNTFGVLSVPLYLKYRMSKVFSLEGGNGKAFLGDGYRSVLLSDQSAEYPFVRIVADINKMKYMHQISRWRQQSVDGNNETKFAATHYLSWMISKKINISFFESVIWKSEDSIRQRGFEWLYLNPVMFFRPAEFALGSPDNMLIGGNISWNFLPKTKLYAQIALDEFFVSEIKNWMKHLLHPLDSSIQHGAWVNKQAFQIGVKSMDVVGVDGLSCMFEFNYARPYVWSHRDPMLSNTNMNQPVAHPMGSNFYEFIFRSQYEKQKWSAHLNAMYYVTGLDSVGTHYGQDLLQSTFDSPQGNGNIPVQYYGNTVGQGIRHDITQLSVEYRRRFSLGNFPFTWRIGALYRNDKLVAFSSSKSEKYLFTGLFLNLNPGEWNQR